MKRVLLATSALIGASVIGGTATHAAMMAPELTISGNLEFIMRTADGKLPGNLGGVDATMSGSAVTFGFTGETADGWNYGGSSTINPAKNTLSPDGASIFMSGVFGKIEMGRVGSAAGAKSGGTAVLPKAAYDSGKWKDGMKSSTVSAGFGLATDNSANGVKYTGPEFGGLSFSLSYHPNSSDGYDTAYVSDAGGLLNQFGMSMSYNGDFGDFGTGFTLSYGMGTPASNSTKVENFNPALTKTDMENSTSLHVGGKVNFAGIGVGVGYGGNGNSGCNKNDDNCDGGTWIDAGVAYGVGPVDFGVGYLQASKKVAGNDQTRTAITLEAKYKVADGLEAFGGLLNNTDAAGVDGVEDVTSSVVVVGTKVSF